MKELGGSRAAHHRFRTDDSVDQISLDSPQRFTFLYTEGSKLVMMHTTSFEQIELSKDDIGDQRTAHLPPHLVWCCVADVVGRLRALPQLSFWWKAAKSRCSRTKAAPS